VLALVLAGGEGQRLRPLTDERAKPAVPFGGRYRLIDFVLSNLVNSGYYQIKVLTQYKASSLISHITRGWQLAPILGHFVEPVPAQMRVGRDWFKGSADAVYQNLNLISDTRPDLVAVFGADHIYKMDVSQMVRWHLANRAQLTVAAIPVPVEEAHAFGVFKVNDRGWAVDFVEKSSSPPTIPGDPTRCLASMGNYLFNTDVLVSEIIRDAERTDSRHDFGASIVTSLVKNGEVLIYDFNKNTHFGMTEKERGYWRDVGTLEALWDASMDLIAVTPDFSLYNQHWPIRTTYQHLPLAKFVFADDSRMGRATDSMISPGCIISGGNVHRSVLGPSVRVHSWADVHECVLGDSVDIARHAHVRRAVFDKGVTVAPRARVGFDHEHDRARGLTVTERGIVAAPKDLHIPA